MINLITYDLRKPGRDYSSLFEAIKTLGAWAHPVESVWLSDTSCSPAEIRDKLQNLIDSNDILFVVQLRKHWASSSLDARIVEWLKDLSRIW